MEEKICGRTKEEIRKSFFKGKIKALIAEIQETEYLNELDLKKLEEYLTELQTEDKAVHSRLAEKFPDEFGEEAKPPSVDDLVGEEENLEKWIKDKDDVLNDVRAKMKMMRTKVSDKNFDIKELQDLAFELTFWMNWINQDVVWTRQNWKKRLIQIMEEHGVNRRTAEDYSELTKEYRDYRLAQEFKDTIDNLIISARKGYVE
jgi:hypothetical protein